jgi:hypothetical protein
MLGKITSSTDPAVYTFNNYVGAVFSTIQFCFELDSISDTSSPDLLYFIFSYAKMLPAVWDWQLTIQEFEDINTEKSLRDLESAAMSRTLVPFVFKKETYYVRVAQVETSMSPYEEAIGKYKVQLEQPV